MMERSDDDVVASAMMLRLMFVSGLLGGATATTSVVDGGV